MAKLRWRMVGVSKCLNWLVINMQASADKTNGTVSIQSKLWCSACICHKWLIKLDKETRLITIKLVALMVAAEKLLTVASAGTITNPPPTPNSPDKKPANTPVKLNLFVQEAVQNNLDVAGLSMQAGASLSWPASWSASVLLANHIFTAIYTMMLANNRCKPRCGRWWVASAPSGADTIPKPAINKADL